MTRRHAALAARLDAVATLRRKHRSTIIHWAVEDWLRRYGPGIRAGLAGASQAAKQARDRHRGGAAPAAQTDLEDAAIEGAVSIDTAADEKAALAKLGEAIPADAAAGAEIACRLHGYLGLGSLA